MFRLKAMDIFKKKHFMEHPTDGCLKEEAEIHGVVVLHKTF